MNNKLFEFHQVACRVSIYTVDDTFGVRGMVQNRPLLRRAGNINGRPWVHAVMCDNTYSDIRMIIHASTL